MGWFTNVLTSAPPERWDDNLYPVNGNYTIAKQVVDERFDENYLDRSYFSKLTQPSGRRTIDYSGGNVWGYACNVNKPGLQIDRYGRQVMEFDGFCSPRPVVGDRVIIKSDDGHYVVWQLIKVRHADGVKDLWFGWGAVVARYKSKDEFPETVTFGGMHVKAGARFMNDKDR